MAQREIEIVIKAKDEASSTLGQIEGALSSLGGSGNNFLTSALEPINQALEFGLKTAATIATGAVVGLSAAFVQAVRDSATFEQAIADIAAISGADTQQLQQLSDLARELGLSKDLKVETEEAAEAIEMLLRNGVKVEDVLAGAARGTILLANATGTEGYAEAADIATDAIKLFNMEAEDMVHVADQISGVVNNSKFDLVDYHYALTNAGGVANLMGISFEELNAVMAATSQNYRTGREAGTNLKVMMGFLIPKSEATADAMRALGIITGNTITATGKATEEFAALESEISSLDPAVEGHATRIEEIKKRQQELQAEMTKGQNLFFEQDGSMKSLAEIAQILQDKMGHLSDEEQGYYLRKIFGNEAWKSGIELMRLGSAGVEQWKQEIGDVSAEDNALARMNTLQSQWEILGDIYQEFSRQIGDSIKGPLLDFVKWAISIAELHGPQLVAWGQQFINTVLVPLLHKFQEWVGDGTWIIHWLQETYTKFVQLATGVWNAITAIQAFIQPIIEHLSQFVSLNDLLTALGILVGVTLVANFLGFVAALTPFFILLGGAVALVAGIRSAWETDWLGIKTSVEGALTSLGGGFEGFKNTLSQNLLLALADVKAFASGQDTEWTGVKTLWANIKEFFRQVWNGIKDNLKEWAAYKEVQKWAQELKDKWDELRTFTTDLKNTWDELKPSLVAVVEVLGTLAMWVQDNRAYIEGLVVTMVAWNVAIGVGGLLSSLRAVTVALLALNPWLIAIAAGVGLVYVAFKNDWIPLSPQVETSFDEIGTAASLLWSNITENAPGALTELKLFIQGVETDFTHTQSIIEGFKGFFATVWKEITAIFEDALQPILDWLQETFPDASAKFMETWEDVQAKLKELWGKIKNAWDVWSELFVAAVKKILDDIKEWWSKHGDQVIHIVDTWITFMITLFGGFFKIIIDLLSAFIALMSGDWQGFLDNMNDAGEVFVDTVTGLFSGAWELIKSVAILAWDNIKAAVIQRVQELYDGIKAIFDITGLTTHFSNVGSNLVGGLISGINGRIQELGTKIGEMMGLVNSVPVEEAEIQSPSQVWKHYGEMLGLGLQEGATSSLGEARNIVATQVNEIGQHSNTTWLKWLRQTEVDQGKFWSDIREINNEQAGIARLETDKQQQESHHVWFKWWNQETETNHQAFWSNIREINNEQSGSAKREISEQLAGMVDVWNQAEFAILEDWTTMMNGLLIITQGVVQQMRTVLDSELTNMTMKVDSLTGKLSGLTSATTSAAGQIIQSRQVFNEFNVQVQGTSDQVADVRNQIELYKLAASTP